MIQTLLRAALALLAAPHGHTTPAAHTPTKPAYSAAQASSQVGSSLPIHIDGRAIMPLGDSITVGYCSAVGNGYRGVLDDLLTAASRAHVFVGSQVSGSMANPQNEGHGGWTIDELTSNVAGWLAATPANKILLDAGTNDDGQGRTSSQMLASMAALLSKIHQVSPYSVVYVAQITITTYNTSEQQQAEADFDAGLPALAGSAGPWVHVVDMRDAELSPAACACGPPGVHPDDAGYAKMAAHWFDALTAPLPTAPAGAVSSGTRH